MRANLLMPTAPTLALAVLLSGCASSAPQPLYRWDGYENQVYGYLRSTGATRAQQIQALEQGLIESGARNAALPPGYQAHLGLLYLDAGRTDEALRAWESEKAAFPESAQYIDYLIGNLKKGG
ncbi:DUF4810 domain-containing protein [Comamonas endophytica]|uniref:DUF4810 domain-containing protein n=1 Tax=Comamonas endophytica TaxID=2949090 RepID=A0ABY6G7T5_9BURK|nr:MULTISPECIES: DUF4810 domain-containing protein [unclassified Acidovorax]MCD2511429.1 DUF4810 domain-containing protein [Acidovorax sp. D4N7]UYG50820.1 DUF4810 domain-containing protein [Acidovorax sp. 5MLIR]